MEQLMLFSNESTRSLPLSGKTVPPSPVLKRALNGCLIPDSRLWQINEAWLVLEAATLSFRTDHVFLLFSGGYDSLVTTHLSMLLLQDMIRKYASHFGDRPPAIHVLHLQTGIGVPQTREYVRNVAQGYGWHYLEYATSESYEQSVCRYGFPGPAQHSTMYSRLKERALRMAVRDYTPLHPFTLHRQELAEILTSMQRLPLLQQYRLIRLMRRVLTQSIKVYREEELRPILFVTGARRLESVRRMGTVQPMRKQGRHWWLSPLTSWSEHDVLDYRDAHQLPHNLVADLLHKSGDCLCGAFAKAGELEELSFWFPEVGAYIKALERRVLAAGFRWGWEGSPPRIRRRKSSPAPGQRVLPGFEFPVPDDEEEAFAEPHTAFSPLCSSCTARFERDKTGEV